MEDITGKKYGDWVVIEFDERKAYNYYWKCRCKCGREFSVLASNLKRSKNKCCRHCSRERHGHAKNRTPTYISWLAMRSRVSGAGKSWSTSDRLQYMYGHVGICERWNIYENFLADMGERPPGMSLDRIDGMGNYEPGNCRWATIHQQLKNRRKTRSAH